MSHKSNFSGMNLYVERSDIWPEIHYRLISGPMRTLNPVLNPKYRAAVDKRVYRDAVLVGMPDTTVVHLLTPEDVEPAIDLMPLLNQAYQEAALNLVIDYVTPPEPALKDMDMAWISTLK